MNEAISKIPYDYSIWVNAAMLEETLGVRNVKKVNDIIRRAIKKLEKTGF